MKIVIVGCGKIGTAIIANLVDEGHDVVAVDSDPKVLEHISNIHDVMSVCGSGADCDTLNEAGVDKAQLIVAVTASDELNMLCCYIAGKMGAKHTIARIRKPEYNMNNLNFLKQQLNLSMSLNPELLAAREIYNILRLPSALKIETFSQRNFEIIEIMLKEDSMLTGVKLMNIRSKLKSKFLVCVVQRGKDVYIPDGNFVLEKGDKIALTASPSEVQKLMRKVGLDRKKAKNIIILGGSRIAYYLARMLTQSDNSVKIIEKNNEKCRQLSEVLDKTVVINGDGAQQELLMEEGLNSADAFVALTGMDEENILISIFADANHVPKSIAKVNKNELFSMASKLGLDCIVSPQKTVADVLVQYARALENSMGSNVETLYKIMDDKAEVLEFNVSDDFKSLNIPLKDLKLRKNILIGGIIRERKAIIPTGDDKILKGDKVIIVESGIRLNDLSEILS
ncbi:MAG: Trk system potassium transporter TrkA [Clostridia bacterium]|nr:Trk system potassium transporter TrkA [Clostridia bacterium]